MMPSGSTSVPLPVPSTPGPDYEFKCKATRNAKPHVCRYCTGKRKQGAEGCQSKKAKADGKTFAAQMSYIMKDMDFDNY